MATHGGLILVTGFYGAGTSKLARAALDALDSLEYLQTVTTRPPRPEEGSLNQNGTVPQHEVCHNSLMQKETVPMTRLANMHALCL